MNDSQPMEDRNFDDLAHRFKRNVYASLKGRIRLQVLARDFADFLPEFNTELPEFNTELPEFEAEGPKAAHRRVLDAGGGQGQMALHFAERGHDVLLCDISAEMLALARENMAGRKLPGRVELRQQAIQALNESDGLYDLVLCHAVLEWVVEPQALLQQLSALLKPGAALSLIYYNQNGLVYKNLLRTNFKKLRRQQWRGYRGSLTPNWPLQPQQVREWIANLPLQVECESGIRVFYDYIFDPQDRSRDPEGIIEMELAHSRLMPYRHLGRYIHLLCRRLPD